MDLTRQQAWPIPADHADEELLLELERSEGQSLFGFLRRLGLSDSEAQDVAQEVFYRLWRHLGSGGPITNAKGWAYQTGYRLANGSASVTAARRRAGNTARPRHGWRSRRGRPDRPVGRGGSTATAAARGPLPQISIGSPVRRDRRRPRHHLERRAQSRDPGDGDAQTSIPDRGRGVMDIERIESLLRAGPPAEPRYRPVLALGTKRTSSQTRLEPVLGWRARPRRGRASIAETSMAIALVVAVVGAGLWIRSTLQGPSIGPPRARRRRWYRHPLPCAQWPVRIWMR